MNLAFICIAFILLASAAAAMALRQLIHSALLLVVSWFALAVFYLWAGAEFVAFAQVLVYAGAISMVVLFAVLLTQRTRGDIIVGAETPRQVVAAVITGGAVASTIVFALIRSPLPASARPATPLSVHELGQQLMGPHAAALLVIGVILTVALIGAVAIAAPAADSESEDAP